MTNKEKYLKRIAGKESVAMQQAKWHNANREWLRESQKLALKVLLELDNKNMSQKELAEAIGKSPQYVNKLLRGNEKFGFEVLVKIQNALQIGLLSTFEPKPNKGKLVAKNSQPLKQNYLNADYSDCKIIDLGAQSIDRDAQYLPEIKEA